MSDARSVEEVEKDIEAHIREAVALGAKRLDEIRPGWRNEIDTEELELASCSRCVLGQLFGGFGIGKEMFLRHFPVSLFDASGMGFDVSVDHVRDLGKHEDYRFDYWAHLRSEWISVIEQGRG